MPTILVAETRACGKRRLLNIVFPRLTDSKASEHSRWEWPELRVSASSIQGFGLFPRSTASLNWASLERPVVLPYLGKETEVESHTQARVLRSVLCGNFDLVKRSELHTLRGHEWVQVCTPPPFFRAYTIRLLRRGKPTVPRRTGFT